MDTKRVATGLLHIVELAFVAGVLLIFWFIIDTYMFDSASAQALFGDVPRINFSSLTKNRDMEVRFKEYEKRAAALAPVASASGTARAVPVLAYHAFLGEQQDEDHSISEFEDHMFALKAAGWQTITIGEYHDFMAGRIELPKKSFLLTFDDGRKDTYYPADPLLRALGYNGVMYVITVHILAGGNNPYYLSKKELQEAIATGRWDVQSHGRYDHDPMVVDENGRTDLFIPNRKWLEAEKRAETYEEHRARVEEDLRVSKADIASLFGKEPVSYAIPRGDFGQTTTTIEMVTRALRDTYPISFFQVRPDAETGYYTYNYSGLDTMAFSRRIKVPLNMSGADVVKLIESGQDKQLPYSRTSWEDSYGWVRDSDVVNQMIKNNALWLAPYEHKTNTHAFLDGTRHWQNYSFTADATLESGRVYKLLARAVNGMNYVSCVYYQNRVRLQQMSNGVERLVAENRFVSFDPHVRHRSGIAVSPAGVSCLLNGRQVVRAAVPMGTPTHGGIGIKVWDVLDNNTTISVFGVEVTPL